MYIIGRDSGRPLNPTAVYGVVGIVIVRNGTGVKRGIFCSLRGRDQRIQSRSGSCQVSSAV
jgi:hypothetical protein